MRARASVRSPLAPKDSGHLRDRPSASASKSGARLTRPSPPRPPRWANATTIQLARLIRLQPARVPSVWGQRARNREVKRAADTELALTPHATAVRFDD